MLVAGVVTTVVIGLMLTLVGLIAAPIFELPVWVALCVVIVVLIALWILTSKYQLRDFS